MTGNVSTLPAYPLFLASEKIIPVIPERYNQLSLPQIIDVREGGSGEGLGQVAGHSSQAHYLSEP